MRNLCILLGGISLSKVTTGAFREPRVVGILGLHLARAVQIDVTFVRLSVKENYS